MTSKRLVVAGGSGFLGSRICQSAVTRGWDVVSLSRHGEPTWSSISSSTQKPGWAKSVQWAKADILNPDTYTPYLKDASAVVHSMGILLEMDYKHLLQGQGSLASGLQKAFRCPNQGDGAAKNQLTYKTMNTDSAVTLAKRASEAKIATFAYISASGGPPLIGGGYIKSKRDAEAAIASQLPDMRSLFIRPNFMYDSSRKPTMPIALGGIIGSEVNSLIGGRLSFLGLMVERPVKVGTVGQAVVEAIDDEKTQGVVGPKKIEQLANLSWRRSML